MPQTQLYFLADSFPLSQYSDLADQYLVFRPQAFLGLTHITPVSAVETKLTFSNWAISTHLTDTIAMSPTVSPVMNRPINISSTIISQQSNSPIEEYPQTQQPANSEVPQIPIGLWGLIPILIIFGLVSVWMLRNRSSQSEPITKNHQPLSTTPQSENQALETTHSATKTISETDSVSESYQFNHSKSGNINENSENSEEVLKQENEETILSEIRSEPFVVIDNQVIERYQDHDLEADLWHDTEEKTEDVSAVENEVEKSSQFQDLEASRLDETQAAPENLTEVQEEEIIFSAVENEPLAEQANNQIEAAEPSLILSVTPESDNHQIDELKSTQPLPEPIFLDSETDSETETQDDQTKTILSEELTINSAIAEPVKTLEENQIQSPETEHTDSEIITNFADQEERITENLTDNLTETENVALTGGVASVGSTESLDTVNEPQEVDEIKATVEASEAVNPSLYTETLEIENISAATSDTLDSTADSSTRVGGAIAGMAFPEIDNGSDSASDSRSDSAQDIKQTTDTISSMTDVPRPQTETSQPATPKHSKVASSIVEASAEASEEESSLSDHKSWIVLELHDPENLYAYWNILDEDRQQIRQQGGQQFALRFYDVTFIDMDVQKPHSLQEYECEESAKELYIHVPMKERDYIAEIGYVTEEGRWLKLVRSTYIHFPWDFPWPEKPPQTTDEAEDEAEDKPEVETPEPTDKIEPSPEDQPEETETITNVEQPPTKSGLDVISTEETAVIEPPSTSVKHQEFDQKIPSAETVQTTSQPNISSPKIEQPKSVHKVEIFSIESPQLVEEPSKASTSAPETLSEDETQSNIAATKFNLGQSETIEQLAVVDEGLPKLPEGYGETKIVLLPIDPNFIYVYWDIPNEDREKLRQQGGKQLALRVCDVTEIDLDTQDPYSVEFYECDELAREWHISIPMSDRDYLVEIGYITNDQRWLLLARSLHVRVPPIYPSDREDYQQRTVTWEENLRGNFFFNLRSTDSLFSFLNQTIQMFQNPFSNPIIS
ncbi:DUF4912 domain-containing protein [Lyngbya sp. PCC 8106]|uniref:DUF4912 domain-containing protein n=1 Tax=Lyngbya sp. (strain PCC 8106) TaxID=313612 RepID=UPI0000EAC34B|nr:DUF4912 domain-containing protein [Lyngbya sp. PCC 8106]EAW38538.1 hypothetical protein L8106_07044 [Lyngbya sp. PCC 8106]